MKTETITLGGFTLEIEPVHMPPLSRIEMHGGTYGEVTCDIEKEMVSIGDKFDLAGGIFIVKESTPKDGFCSVVAAAQTKKDFDVAMANLINWA